jgi:hypothetical protein
MAWIALAFYGVIDSHPQRLREEVPVNPVDPTRVREEKARLYQNAVAAWERGEVASALDTLEKLAALDRDFPDPETGRGSTYRNFYNQVKATLLKRLTTMPGSSLRRAMGMPPWPCAGNIWPNIPTTHCFKRFSRR